MVKLKQNKHTLGNKYLNTLYLRLKFNKLKD